MGQIWAHVYIVENEIPYYIAKSLVKENEFKSYIYWKVSAKEFSIS